MSKKTERRKVNPLSLSFLDVMFCGFGAVILIFLILDHTSTNQDAETTPELSAEINLLEEEVEDGQEGLVQLRNTVDEVSLDVVTAEGLANQIQDEVDNFMQELAALENNSLATVESEEQLRSDIEQLEQDIMRLQALSMEQEGNSVRQHIGDGNRQYLSGLFLGGQRILLLIDSSASMLDSTLVNIIRTRNMPDDRKRAAPKWQRVVRTVDWVSTQLPVTSQYQIWEFADDTASVIPGMEMDRWLEVADRSQLNEAMDAVRQLVPNNGTNLQQVFQAVANMSPMPDNIFLITDGLPTLNGRNSSANTISQIGRAHV